MRVLLDNVYAFFGWKRHEDVPQDDDDDDDDDKEMLNKRNLARRNSKRFVIGDGEDELPSPTTEIVITESPDVEKSVWAARNTAGLQVGTTLT